MVECILLKILVLQNSCSGWHCSWCILHSTGSIWRRLVHYYNILSYNIPVHVTSQLKQYLFFPFTYLFYVSQIVWMIIGMIGSFLFILIQLVLIVDFAHAWNEKWVGNYEEADNKWWYVGKLVMYTGSMTLWVSLFFCLYIFRFHVCISISYVNYNSDLYGLVGLLFFTIFFFVVAITMVVLFYVFYATVSEKLLPNVLYNNSPYPFHDLCWGGGE